MTVSNLKKRFPNKHRLMKRGRGRDEKSQSQRELNLEKKRDVRDLQRDLQPPQCVLKPDFAPMQKRQITEYYTNLIYCVMVNSLVNEKYGQNRKSFIT